MRVYEEFFKREWRHWAGSRGSVHVTYSVVAIEYWKIEVAVFLPLPHPKNKTFVDSPEVELYSYTQPHIIDSTEMANNCMSFT